MAEGVRWLTTAEVVALGLDPTGREDPGAPGRLRNELGPVPRLERLWLEEDVREAVAAQEAGRDREKEEREEIWARFDAAQRARSRGRS